jgi:drug/metabolite transporter (DMT)-like permease
VTGALWSIASGVGFGFSQSLNRRGMGATDDAYLTTFVQLLVAAVVLVSASAASEDLGMIADATPWSLVLFAIAGVVHFLFGWTFLNLSQKRIGAARTAPLLVTTPLFGLVIAAVFLGEMPPALALLAIVPVIIGAYVLEGGGQEARGRDAVFGLGTALMWAISAVLTLEALEGLPSPLLGVTIGMLAAVAAYGAALLVHRARYGLGGLTRSAMPFKLAGAVVLALATWARLVALEQIEVAVVLALNLVCVPVVLLLAPILMGRHVERVTARIWGGAALVVFGTLSLITVG